MGALKDREDPKGEVGIELFLNDSGSQTFGIQEPRKNQQGHHTGLPLFHDAR